MIALISPLEEKILRKVSEMQLLTKVELKRLLKDNGGEYETAAIDISVKNLSERGLLTTISPIGSTCFIATKKGIAFLDGL